MKKSYLFLATAAVLAVSCASDDFVGGNPGETTQGKAIKMGGMTGAITRADQVGGAAADLLGKNYVIEGIKGNGDYSGTLSQVEVFDHYNVNWVANTAHSTTSNSSDWEYVGQDAHSLSALNTAPAQKQTIKFWDYSASQYDFIAFSYGKSNTTKLALTEIKYANLGNDGKTTDKTEAVYTITGTTSNLQQAYVADLVTAYKTVPTGAPSGTLTYQGVVTPKFRSLGAKVRVGFFEKVPGYSVKDVKFYLADATAAADANGATLFGATAAYPAADASCTMSVYYPTVGSSNINNSDYNQAHVVYSTDATLLGKDVTFGALNYLAAAEGKEKDAATVKYLGRESTKATYALPSGTAPTTEGANAAYYVTMLPYEAGQALTLKVDYTLVPTDGAEETIKVTGATATVPAVYTAWKANYAYTYLFKISQNTNGTTGGSTDPAGLYPITFDAVVTETTDGIQETITTVSTPSLTTYSKGVQPTATAEYATGKNIYVSLENPGTATLTTSNTKLYTVTLEDGAAQTINEASVANALVNYNGVTASSATTETVTVGTTDVSSFYTLDGGVYCKCAAGSVAETGKTYYSIGASNITGYVVKDANGKKMVVTIATAPSIVDKIAATDAPDGNEISGNFAMFNVSTAGTYVFEYTDSSSKKHYKIIIVH